MGPFVWNSNQNTPQLPAYSLYIKGGVATPNLDMTGYDMRKWAKELLDYLHVNTWDEYCQGPFDPCAWITIPACGSTDPLNIYNYGSGGVTITTSGCTWTFDDDCNLTLPGAIIFPDGTTMSSVTNAYPTITDGLITVPNVKYIYFSGATVSAAYPSGIVIGGGSGSGVVSGTTNYIPYFNSISSVTSSQFYIAGGNITSSGGAYVASAAIDPSIKKTAFGVSLDGQGTTVSTGQKGYFRVPYSGTITGWSIISSVAGTIVFDVWKAAGTIPTVSNSITGSAKPTLTSSTYINSTTLTGWTTTVTAGDIIGFNVDSTTYTVTWVILEVYITKS